VEKDDPADGWFPESVAADYDAPGGNTVAVTIGDMTTTRVAGQFSRTAHVSVWQKG